jgi:propionyl-CoA carboxylase alpha chain
MLAAALRRARIHGPTNNRALLVRILEHPEFLAGNTDTGFLDRNSSLDLGRPLLGPEDERIAAVVAALSDRALAAEKTPVLASIPQGWRNSQSQAHSRVYDGEYGRHEVGYLLTRDGLQVDDFAGVPLSVTPGAADMSLDGEPIHFTISRNGPIRYVDSPIGPGRLVEVSPFPTNDADEVTGSIHAPMPGKVIRVSVAIDQQVVEGQVLMVMEAMKMEHTIRAPHSGVVTEVRYQAGNQVEADVVLVVIDEE